MLNERYNNKDAMRLVLDKSYLQSSSREKIHELCTNHCVIMPEVLLMEILTTEKKEEMKSCLTKFPTTDDPIAVIPTVGCLMRYEIYNHHPCHPIESFFLKGPLYINPKLFDGSFVFTEEQTETLKNWEGKVIEDCRRFIEKAVLSESWFPEIGDYKPGMPIDGIELAVEKITSDSDFIKSVYEQIYDEITKIRDEKWPNASIIDDTWILYRYHQMHLLSSVQYIKKYGKRIISDIAKYIINYRLDVDYCVIGSLVDGLLTKDNEMACLYTLLCPDKCLIKE